MGLDVVAYKGIKKVDPELWSVEDNIWDVCARNDWFIPSTTAFIEHALDIEDGVPYSSEGEISFRAGSYGGYNQWRNQLAILAGYDSAENVWEMEHPWGKPFVELINFSDCEGTIGSALCVKLLKDFEDHEDQASKFAVEHGDSYFLTVYDDFLSALRFAGDHGILAFC